MYATHLYKDQPIKLIALTYVFGGHQYCTIEMVNKLGKVQRQTVMERNLKPLDDRYCEYCGTPKSSPNYAYHICIYRSKP